MFRSWQGTTPGNPYLGGTHLYVVLAHPLIADALVLAQHTEKPYQRNLTDLPKQDGRSLMGGLKMVGPRYAPPPKWEMNVLVKPHQMELFESLLFIQRNSVNAITLQDFYGPGDVHPVWLDVDDRYRTEVAACRWWQLQFAAYREV
jgi:hypothetical protein